jgi:hypothetical protein
MPKSSNFLTAWFRFAGSGEQPIAHEIEAGVTVVIPDWDSPIKYQEYRQPAEKSSLELPVDNTKSEKILQNVKYPFGVLYPHQYIEFTLQDSFFLQDIRRTFLARYRGSQLKSMADPNKLTLAGIGDVQGQIAYEKGPQPAIDPIPSASVSLTDLQSQAKLGISEGSA